MQFIGIFEMSESESLGSSSSSCDADPFSSILGSFGGGQSIPQPFGASYSPVLSGMCPPVVSGSFGLAPTPPPLNEQVVKCPLCLEPFREPKVLACFHSFCKPCLERQLDSSEKIVCPQCHMETQLSLQLGIDSLLSDYGLESVLSRQLSLDDKGLIFGSPSSTSSSPPLSDSPCGDQNSNTVSATSVLSSCTGCKSGERASAFCQTCSHYLCQNCTMAHQYMHCFDGHRVEPLLNSSTATTGSSSSQTSGGGSSSTKCLQHRLQPLRFFCMTCNLAICRDCTMGDHPAPTHHFEPIGEVAEKQMATMEALVGEARGKHSELLDMFKAVDSTNQRLSESVQRAHANLNESVAAISALLDEQKKAIAKEIDAAYSSKHLQLTMVDKRIQQMTDKLSQTIDFTARLIKYASPTEVMVFKQLLDTRLQLFLAFNPDVSNVLSTPCEIEMPSLNLSLAKQHVSALLGQVRGNSETWTAVMPSAQTGMPPTPIGRPPSRQMVRSPQQQPCQMAASAPSNCFSSSLENAIPIRHPVRMEENFSGSSSLGPFSGEVFNQYEKWSSALEPSLGLMESSDMSELDKANALFPPSCRSQIKRTKMIYHCKFGEFGVMEGQFTEPSGVAVNAQNDIVVADTNNHRIQVFDKEGRFKFQFGECGKRDGQLLYPNRVAVNKMTGDFVVTERSPTHQIQVYNQYGQFMRKFGANILQHPRGVCVDNKGRIIVVECKVMRVIIFDMFGNILQKFSCSRYLEFPNGVCTNDKNEILISDNRAHCIKVFSYEGQFIRQIGGEGVTNYPIGVGINSMGEVVVADNHNNFNLTVFSQDGTLIGALESKVKHAQCFDVALVDDGSVVLASKDYRLYLYRFQPGMQ